MLLVPVSNPLFLKFKTSILLFAKSIASIGSLPANSIISCACFFPSASSIDFFTLFIILFSSCSMYLFIISFRSISGLFVNTPTFSPSESIANVLK